MGKYIILIDFNLINKGQALSSLGRLDALKGSIVLSVRSLPFEHKPLTIYSLDEERPLDDVEIEKLKAIISVCKKVGIVREVIGQEIDV